MYRVMLYENFEDTKGFVVHEPNSFGNKIISGKLKQVVNGISDFEFSIGISNSNYKQITPITNLITIINETNGNVEFKGRIASYETGMDNDGLFSQNIYCESILAYLHDSIQTYKKVQNTTIQDFFKMIIDRHNAQVEPHKQFIVGRITVENSTDNVYRYLGYESTFDTIRDKLINRLGGYLVLRQENNGLYLDYLKDYGDEVDSPIQIAANLQSATREIDIDEMATRIVPLGADLETQDDENDHSQDASRPRLTITSVNNNIEWLEDPELVKKFGIIQKSINWNDVTIPSNLKSKGLNYLKDQRTYLTTWTISAVEIGLMDKRYENFTLGNKYPIILPQVSDKEVLQVIEKNVDILNPQKSTLTIGSGKQTLSSLQLEAREQGQAIDQLNRSAFLFTKNVQRIDTTVKEVSQSYTAVSENVQQVGEKVATLDENQLTINQNLERLAQETQDQNNVLITKIEELEKRMNEMGDKK